MKVQHKGIVLTNEVTESEDGLYIFNQEATLSGDHRQQDIELTVNLLTDMGSKYLAGTVKISSHQMISYEKDNMMIAVSRCMDNQAYCQLKVQRVVRKARSMYRSREPKSIPKRSILHVKSRDHEHEEMERSPTMKNIYQIRHTNAKTEY